MSQPTSCTSTLTKLSCTCTLTTAPPRRQALVSTGDCVNKRRLVERLKHVAAYAEKNAGSPDKLVIPTVLRHVIEEVNPTLHDVPLYFSAPTAENRHVPASLVTRVTRLADSVEQLVKADDPEADAEAAGRMLDDQEARLGKLQEMSATAAKLHTVLIAKANTVKEKLHVELEKIRSQQKGRFASQAETYKALSDAHSAAYDELLKLQAVLNDRRQTKRNPDKLPDMRHFAEVDIDEFDDDDEGALREVLATNLEAMEKRMRADKRGLIAAYIGLTTFISAAVEDKPPGVGGSYNGRAECIDHKMLTDTFAPALKLFSSSGNEDRLRRVAAMAERLGIDRIAGWAVRPRLPQPTHSTHHSRARRSSHHRSAATAAPAARASRRTASTTGSTSR